MTAVGPELAVMLPTWLDSLGSEPCLAPAVKSGSVLAPLMLVLSSLLFGLRVSLINEAAVALTATT